MAKFTIEIDGAVIPPGFIPAAFRRPIVGECILRGRSTGTIGRDGFFHPEPALILKAIPVWPRWLHAKCAAKDGDGQWFAYQHIVSWNGFERMWAVPDVETRTRCVWLSPALFDLAEFPVCAPEKSLWVNPNWVEPAPVPSEKLDVLI